MKYLIITVICLLITSCGDKFSDKALTSPCIGFKKVECEKRPVNTWQTQY